MIRLCSSFYLKISSIFLCLIIILGTVILTITFSASEKLYDEAEQILNREYANSIAVELQPMLKDGFSYSSLKNAIHYMMVLNPMVDIYILDAGGRILGFFTGPGDKVLKEEIDLKPVNLFISGHQELPILGDDPRVRDKLKPFSAATLKMGKRSGYVYVILRGEDYDRSIKGISGGYYFKAGISVFLIAVLLTVISGLILFFILTRRLRILNIAVRDFKDGNYKRKVHIKGRDELSFLGETFNRMADSINNNVEKLRIADKEKSDLITNISHDLRSPFTAIKGYIETIQMKKSQLTDLERDSYLEIALKSIDNYQLLLDKLFQLVKLENNQIQYTEEFFDICELCHDVVMKFKNRADDLNITLVMCKPDNIPQYIGDISMIERALSNIVENSINFTPEKGRIEVSVANVKNEIIISIVDNGTGIDSMDLPNIFNRFFKNEFAPNRAESGSGLGLAIVREIIHIHKGSIKVNSKIGKGTEFIISLPCKR